MKKPSKEERKKLQENYRRGIEKKAHKKQLLRQTIAKIIGEIIRGGVLNEGIICGSQGECGESQACSYQCLPSGANNQCVGSTPMTYGTSDHKCVGSVGGGSGGNDMKMTKSIDGTTNVVQYGKPNNFRGDLINQIKNKR